MRITTTCLLVCCVVSFGSVRANACGFAWPTPGFAPPALTPLPVNPTLHVVDLEDGRSIRVHGAQNARVTRVAPKMFRVDLETGGSRAITISALSSDKQLVEATYRIEPDWPQPSPAPVAILASERILDRSTCETVDLIELTLSYAPAYAVEWAYSAEAWARGDRRQNLFSGGDAYQPGTVFLPTGGAWRDDSHVDVPVRPLYIRVTGIYPDGSRTATPGPTLELPTPKVRVEEDAQPDTPWWLLLLPPPRRRYFRT